ncbi:hypothetical protein MMC28_004471 [Mycoblastus sanguinarius]|nr:hypothetical protein [Mycoblastus sanguinarius]
MAIPVPYNTRFSNWPTNPPGFDPSKCPIGAYHVVAFVRTQLNEYWGDEKICAVLRLRYTELKNIGVPHVQAIFMWLSASLARTYQIFARTNEYVAGGYLWYLKQDLKQAVDQGLLPSTMSAG